MRAKKVFIASIFIFVTACGASHAGPGGSSSTTPESTPSPSTTPSPSATPAAGSAPAGMNPNATSATNSNTTQAPVANLAGSAPNSEPNDVLHGQFAQLQDWNKLGDVQTLPNQAAPGTEVVRLTFDGNQAASISKTFDLSQMQGTKIKFQYNYNASAQGALKHDYSYSTDGGNQTANSNDGSVFTTNAVGSYSLELPLVAGTNTTLTLNFTVDAMTTNTSAGPIAGASAGGYADLGNLTIINEP